MYISKKLKAAGLAAALLTLAGTPAMAAPANPLLTSKTGGMVVSTQALADKIGEEVLAKGGNAIDAAAAVGYALAVCHPYAGNIGGGGFAIIHTADGKDMALDFREMAPGAADRDMYLDTDGNVIPQESTRTYKAAGVPGSVAGMNEMLRKYGTWTLKDILAPSIKMAEDGFIINKNVADTMASSKEKFEKFETGRTYFLKPDGSTYKIGDLFVQKDLAEVLKRIAKDGDDGFYKGKTAALIEKDMKANGGLITKDDLAKYHAVWREPSVAK